MGGCVSSSQKANVAQPGTMPRPAQKVSTPKDSANRPDLASKEVEFATPSTNGAPAVATPENVPRPVVVVEPPLAAPVQQPPTTAPHENPTSVADVQEESAGPSEGAEVETAVQQEEEAAGRQEEGLSVVAAGPPTRQSDEEAG